MDLALLVSEGIISLSLFSSKAQSLFAFLPVTQRDRKVIKYNNKRNLMTEYQVPGVNNGNTTMVIFI